MASYPQAISDYLDNTAAATGHFLPTSGRTWWVDSTNNSGTLPVATGTKKAPFSTLAQANTAASSGDTVFVKSGHSETLTAAGSVTLSTAGVRYIGLGRGGLRPTFNYTTAVGASFDVTGANVSIRNFLFTPTGFDAITAAINVTAADCSIIDCEMRHGDATNQAVLGILTSALGTRLTVENCRFYGTTDAGTTAAITLVGGDGHLITDCHFQGAYGATVGAIRSITTLCTNALIQRCTISNSTTNASAKAITMLTGSTGYIRDCTLQIIGGGTAPITGDAMSWAGRNYYASAIATGSTIV